MPNKSTRVISIIFKSLGILVRKVLLKQNVLLPDFEQFSFSPGFFSDLIIFNVNMCYLHFGNNITTIIDSWVLAIQEFSFQNCIFYIP
jgi:hypothetical protein